MRGDNGEEQVTRQGALAAASLLMGSSLLSLPYPVKAEEATKEYRDETYKVGGWVCRRTT